MTSIEEDIYMKMSLSQLRDRQQLFNREISSMITSLIILIDRQKDIERIIESKITESTSEEHDLNLK